MDLMHKHNTNKTEWKRSTSTKTSEKGAKLLTLKTKKSVEERTMPIFLVCSLQKNPFVNKTQALFCFMGS